MGCVVKENFILAVWLFIKGCIQKSNDSTKW
jgi:hypothetical protein